MTHIRTLHRRKIQETLGLTSPISTFYFLPTDEGRGSFSLSALVANLRWNRKKSLSAEQLAAFVSADHRTREDKSIAGRADVSVKESGITGKEFIGVLSFEELPRWQEIRSKILHGWLMASGLNSPLPDIDAPVIHPSVARFILSGENDELPDTKDDWVKWAFDAVMINCEPQLILEAS